jgi:hypothetical protein
MLRFQQLCSAAAILVAASAGSALADTAPTDKTAVGGDPAAAPPAPGSEVEYGIDVRLRNVRVPKGLLELIVESAPGGVSNVGFGVDLVRRRGSTELQLGFEYERIEPPEGVWIQSNTDVSTGDEADFIVSPERNGNQSLSWFTIEFTFLNHAEITKNIAFRYGGGAGLGILRGSLARFNVVCAPGTTNESPEPGCRPTALEGGTGTLSEEGGMMLQKYDLPPVFPVVNVILGLQIRPFGKAVLNIEGGIRTFPFFGVSGGYFF